MSPEGDFPDACIKGIPNTENFLHPNGMPSPNLFQFDRIERDDEYWENSINWLDDEGAISVTLAMKRPDGEFQFRAGLGILPRSEIDAIARKPALKGADLRYERKPLEGNEYHGNILLASEHIDNKAFRRSIEAQIAASVTKVHPRD